MSKPFILLVEDEALIRMDVEAALVDAGFEVCGAIDAQKAVQLFDAQAERLNAVITDIRLGNGASGWDVARHCREGKPGLPVIYVSADSSHDWTSQGVPNSVMISKPFAMVQIVTALATLLTEAGPKDQAGDAALGNGTE